MKKVCLSLFLCFTALSMYSQITNEDCEKIWNEIISNGYYLSLQSYGLYIDGVEVNKFQPSKKTKNKDEYMWLDDDNLYWAASAEGNLMFDYIQDGQYLYLTNKRFLDKKGRVKERQNDYSSWLKIEKYKLLNGTNIFEWIFITSKEGTYRYFFPVKLNE